MRNSYNRSKTKSEKEGEKNKPENFRTKANKRITKRLCLRGGKKFSSKGLHNRICMKCDLIHVRQVRVDCSYVSLRFPEVRGCAETFM